jgi:hypothetical protein
MNPEAAALLRDLKVNRFRSRRWGGRCGNGGKAGD